MKSIKLYVLSAVSIELDESNVNGLSILHFVTAYFTNLKELFNKLEGKGLHSYSTLSSILNKKGIYVRNNIKIRSKNSLEYFNEVTIRKVTSNQLYGYEKYFSLSELVSNAVSNVDLSLSKNYYFREEE